MQPFLIFQIRKVFAAGGTFQLWTTSKTSPTTNQIRPLCLFDQNNLHNSNLIVYDHEVKRNNIYA